MRDKAYQNESINTPPHAHVDLPAMYDGPGEYLSHICSLFPPGGQETTL